MCIHVFNSLLGIKTLFFFYVNDYLERFYTLLKITIINNVLYIIDCFSILFENSMDMDSLVIF